MSEARPQPLLGDPAARVVVAGASGFTGALAAQIVWDHPRLQLVAITGRSDAGTRLDRVYPRYRVPLELAELEMELLEDVDAAIVAYPHGAAAPAVASMRGLGVAVVDLSADFRLRAREVYEGWYGPHGEPALITDAVYGLTELNRDRIREAELVANPGCYPTAALLALAPLAEQGLIADVVIDAKSGVSGAGRGSGDDMHFVALAENAKPYKVEGHRHQPEIEQELAELMPAASSEGGSATGDPSSARARPGAAGSAGPSVTFVPHLLPLDQGELVSCYVTATRDVDAAELRSLYDERYAGEPFVKLVDEAPGVRDVRDSNECQIHVVAVDGRLIAFAAIDNLWKGAAGQAVQNLNLMLGLSETDGLS